MVRRGLYVTNVVWGINKPWRCPLNASFRPDQVGCSTPGRLGRAAVGVLLARPQATVTALDIYNGTTASTTTRRPVS
jgi:hypothetical protein